MRAETPGTPSVLRRDLISPAALVVKVIDSIRCGSITPIADAYAIRWVIARVFPVPAPAIFITKMNLLLLKLVTI